jgi:hypothetical protein
MSPLARALPVLSFLSLASFSQLACTAEATAPETPPAGTGTEAPPETPATTPPETTTPETPKTPEAPKELAKVVFSGGFSTVDVEYGRAGKFIVLDMKGEAGGLKSSDASVGPALVTTVTDATSYELLYPELGGCDAPPKLTFEGTKIKVALSRAAEAGTPSAVSACHLLSRYVDAPDGGFQARLVDVVLRDGRKVKELLIDLKGPPA